MSEETAIARGVRKERTGVVTSRSGNNSVVVTGERRMPHPVYGKVVRQVKKYHADDAAVPVSVGDTVTIVETRPLSKTKRWRVASIISKGEGAK